jgi:insertion element IS1 protein InsB
MIWVAGRSPTLVSHSLRGVATNLKATTLAYLAIVKSWRCCFYVTDGWSVYRRFIADEDHIISKTYMTRVASENTRLRHYLARLHRKTLCYSQSVEMFRYSRAPLLIDFLMDW